MTQSSPSIEGQRLLTTRAVFAVLTGLRIVSVNAAPYSRLNFENRSRSARSWRRMS